MYECDNLISRIAAEPNKRRKQRMNQAKLRIFRRITCLARDLHIKAANFLCSNYSQILIPALPVAQMVRRGRRNLRAASARALLQLAHYSFRQRLLFKSQEYGTQVRIVAENHTTTTCGRCGHLNPGIHQQGRNRQFVCPQVGCGYRCDRDINGARNILIKFIAQV